MSRVSATWIDIQTRLILRTQGPKVDDAGQRIPVEFTEVTEIAFGEQPAGTDLGPSYDDLVTYLADLPQIDIFGEYRRDDRWLSGEVPQVDAGRQVVRLFLGIPDPQRPR